MLETPKKLTCEKSLPAKLLERVATVLGEHPELADVGSDRWTLISKKGGVELDPKTGRIFGHWRKTGAGSTEGRMGSTMQALDLKRILLAWLKAPVSPETADVGEPHPRSSNGGYITPKASKLSPLTPEEKREASADVVRFAREQIQAFACPKCGAAVGKGCTGPTGKPMGRWHAERVGLAAGGKQSKPVALARDVSRELEKVAPALPLEARVAAGEVLCEQPGCRGFHATAVVNGRALCKTHAPAPTPAAKRQRPREQLIAALEELGNALGTIRDGIHAGSEVPTDVLAVLRPVLDAKVLISDAKRAAETLPETWIPVGAEVSLTREGRELYSAAIGEGPFRVLELRAGLAALGTAGAGGRNVEVPLRFLES